MKKLLNIGDILWHPCSMDIIKHKVIGINKFIDFRKKEFVHYTLKATDNVGACGRIEIIIDEHKGKYRFVELINEDNIKYASGLQDFIEGNYYTDENEAKVEFYDKQYYLCSERVRKIKSSLAEAERDFERVKAIIKVAKDNIKINSQNKI